QFYKSFLFYKPTSSPPTTDTCETIGMKLNPKHSDSVYLRSQVLIHIDQIHDPYLKKHLLRRKNQVGGTLLN
ncbi:hypothetical protein HMI55_003378, partial [Coelomomyces lativittatus]